MLYSYIKQSVRRARRSPGYTAINVIGLAIGIAFGALVILYVADELGYDRFHEHADRIYRINGTSRNPEGDFYRTVLPPPVGPALETGFPEIENTVRVASAGPAVVRHGQELFREENILLVDHAFAEVFSFPLVEGNVQSLLQQPGEVVLSQSKAEAYFGSTDPIGQTLLLENSILLTVVGLVEDVPSTSHLQFDMLVSIETPGIKQEGWLTNWGSSATSTYVLIGPEAMPDALQAKLGGFVDRHLAEELDEEEEFTLSMHPLTRIHLNPHVAPEQRWAAGNKRYVVLLSLLAFFILLIVCINYVNLETARSFRRMGEVGVRKVLGSNRKDFLLQFLAETILVLGIALLLSIVLLLVSLPVFNSLTGKEFTLAGLLDVHVLLSMAGFCGVMCMIAGSYPALRASRYSPVAAIRGSTSGSGRAPVLRRNIMVVVQFAAAVLLIVWSSTVRDQLDFINTRDLGFDKEQVLVVPISNQEALQRSGILNEEVEKIPGVLTAARSSGIPNAIGWSSTATIAGLAEEEEFEVHHAMIDFDFLDVLDMEVVQGRPFSRASPSDSTAAYIVNEAAVRAFGWSDPLNQNLHLWGTEAPVIGVVKDFHFESLRNPIGPLVLHFGPQTYRMHVLKIHPDNVVATVESIQAVHERIMPDRPFEYRFLDDTFDELYRAEERFGTLSAYLTALALVLASLGLLGLTATMAEQRTREIGIRKILGASLSDLVGLMTREFLAPVAIAFLLAAPLAYFAVHRWLLEFAYRITIGPGVFVLAAVIILSVTVLTVGIHALRTARSNPVDALRTE